MIKTTKLYIGLTMFLCFLFVSIEAYADGENVEIYTYTNHVKTTVYTGDIDNYSSGAYSWLDFTNSDMFAVFDWTSTTSSTLYFKLLVVDDSASEDDDDSLNDTDGNNSTNDTDDICEDTVFLEDDSEQDSTEPLMATSLLPNGLDLLGFSTVYLLNGVSITPPNCMLLGGDTVQASYTITNRDTVSQDVTLVMSLYTGSGRFVDMQTTTVMIDDDSTSNVTISSTLPDRNTDYYIKVMVIDAIEELKPLYDVYRVGNTSNDIESALLIDTDSSQTVILNADNDVTWVRINALYNDNYTINISNVSLYMIGETGLTQMPTSTRYYLSYPNQYYICLQSDDSFVSILVDGESDKQNTHAFETVIGSNHYYSNLSDAGKLYMNNTIITSTQNLGFASWLCSYNNELYFNANKCLYKLTNDGYSQVSDQYLRNPKVTDDGIIFENWSNEGIAFHYPNDIVETDEIVTDNE